MLARPDSSELHLLGEDSDCEKGSEHDSSSRQSADSSVIQLSDGFVKALGEVESQPSLAAEHSVPARRKLLFLAAYFVLNLFLTLSNKSLLGKIKLPWLLTAVHASATSIGCFAMLGAHMIELSELARRDIMALVAFSFLFTINIAISNVSLAMVSVPFHQIMRSTCPIVTILLYRFIYGRTYSTKTYLTIIPLVLGAGLSTIGDYYFTTLGFFVTLLGVLLASVKTVATNRLLTGTLKLSAPELLLRMSPLAAVQCMLYAFLSGEIGQFRTAFLQGQFSSSAGVGLLLNAMTAFFLNIVGFQANKIAGALTITVCGNVKQALTIALGIAIFQVQVGLVSAIGMVITIAGAAWYSVVELRSKPLPS